MPPEPVPSAVPAGPAAAGAHAIMRFDRVERAVHWTTATLFGVLMATGAVLYAGPFSALFGRRELFRTIHVYAGLALPLPLLIGLAGRWRTQLRRDIGRINRWTRDDARWFRRRHRRRPSRLDLDKFNPGQKLSAVFFAAAGLVMLGTGSMMRWFEPFSNDWRTGATFVHDWFAFGIWIAVFGHLYLAFQDPIALRGMIAGRVTPYWARTERPRWYREVSRASPQTPHSGPPVPR